MRFMIPKADILEQMARIKADGKPTGRRAVKREIPSHWAKAQALPAELVGVLADDQATGLEKAVGVLLWQKGESLAMAQPLTGGLTAHLEALGVNLEPVARELLVLTALESALMSTQAETNLPSSVSGGSGVE
jgi:hypothetical protein